MVTENDKEIYVQIRITITEGERVQVIYKRSKYIHTNTLTNKWITNKLQINTNELQIDTNELRIDTNELRIFTRTLDET